MSLYVIGIGGTGAKCLEAITNLAAVGLLLDSQGTEQPINLLYVDADETNGSLERARAGLALYQRCFSLFNDNNRQSLPWMQTLLRSFGLWSPFGRVTTDKKLGSLFGYDTLKQNAPDLGNLFEVLFTAEEREATLDVGFRGRPAIGSAVMSQVNLDSFDEEAWGQLMGQLKTDAGSGQNPKVVLCGSMFGGTGASGLPTIGRLLSNRLQKEGLSQVPIACIFLLPYFSFTPTGKQENEVFARADQFLLNTEAALQYYLTQAKPFKTVYLLGNQALANVEFSIGKQTQRNKPHFMELYAGLAVRHFLLAPPSPEQTAVVLVSRKQQGRLTWQDLPDFLPNTTEVKERLSNATRFAYVWLANIAPELDRAKKVGIDRFQRDAAWFSKFFQPKVSGIERMMNLGSDELADFNDPKEQQAIAIISEWCKDYLTWIIELQQGNEESIELFNIEPLINLTGETVRTADELSQIVRGTQADRSKLSRDTIPSITIDLGKRDLSGFGKGTIGLARSLYSLCSLQS